jgi:hypothetical protein
VEDLFMNRLVSQLLPLSLLTALGGGCSAPVSLALLVDAPSGTPPASIEVRAYKRTGLLASQTITHPSLPGAIQLTSVPSDDDLLRIVVLGLDDAGKVESLAATTVTTPIDSRTSLPLPLKVTFQDADGDGVPDALDGCPAVADKDQDNSTGYGSMPGDACNDSSSDGGTAADLGGGGSGPDMATPPCPANALCDSFDDTLDQSVWHIGCQGTAASCATIDGQTSYRGGGALHIKLDQTPAQKLEYATVTEIKTFPSSDIFARAFVRVPSSTGNEATSIFTAGQNATPYNAVTLQIENGGFSMYNGIDKKQKYVDVSGTFPKDKWFCLEWELKIGTAGAGKVWVDGTQRQAPLLSGDTTSDPALGQVSFGMTVQAMANAVPAREIWFDEVVIAGKRVGCK